MTPPAGVVAGVLAYVIGRTLLRLRDIHRAALLEERGSNVIRLIQPYSSGTKIDLIEAEEREPSKVELRGHLKAV